MELIFPQITDDLRPVQKLSGPQIIPLSGQVTMDLFFFEIFVGELFLARSFG
jgi:hypothetical protein